MKLLVVLAAVLSIATGQPKDLTPPMHDSIQLLNPMREWHDPSIHPVRVYQPLEMNANRWALLIRINDEVNQYPYVLDQVQFGEEEHWQAISITGKGDCEDYVIEKRIRLIKAGWPASALRLTYLQMEGDGHMVLSVDVTIEGKPTTLIMDEEVKEWHQYPIAYKAMYRMTADTTYWTKVR
jgi:predicted transglutaminase-like cysteine proteinase